MGAASFLAGSLPLSFSLSSRQLRLITALGTGVLVGTSLIVIIPEGVETLYSARPASHSHPERGIASLKRDITLQAEHRPIWFDEEAVRRDIQLDGYVRGSRDEHEPGRTGPDDGFDLDKDDGDAGDSGAHADNDEEFEPHAWIGISLISGFILMYLIDKVPQTAASSSQPQRFAISLNQFSFHRAPSVANESAGTHNADSFVSGSSSPRRSSARSSSTTVGLVIHAAADGIALGASTTSSSSNLSFIIFIALMIHKAPAAFGLTSVLLKQGLSKRMARAHLVIFSLAAPIGALLTWSAVHVLGFSGDSLGESASTEFATGVLLLFSGGTFLYVAVHTMQESGSGAHSHDEAHTMNDHYAGVPLSDPYATHVPAPQKSQSPSMVDTLVTVAGMLLPLLTQFGHAH